MDYTLTRSDLTRLKGKLTRAKKPSDPDKVLEACKAAFDLFDEKGYPDQWHLWEAAKHDAEYAKGRELPLLPSSWSNATIMPKRGRR